MKPADPQPTVEVELLEPTPEELEDLLSVLALFVPKEERHAETG